MLIETAVPEGRYKAAERLESDFVALKTAVRGVITEEHRTTASILALHFIMKSLDNGEPLEAEYQHYLRTKSTRVVRAFYWNDEERAPKLSDLRKACLGMDGGSCLILVPNTVEMEVAVRNGLGPVGFIHRSEFGHPMLSAVDPSIFGAIERCLFKLKGT